jgi:very-short-patch-repair endonuclease
MNDIIVSVGWIVTIVVMVIGALALVIATLFGTRRQQEFQLPYVSKKLMNHAEQRIFRELQRILPNGYVIYPQMVMSAVMRTKGSGRLFWFHHNKINKKTLDFVVFSYDEYIPILAIEYDGKTHKQPRRQARDAFVNKLIVQAGISMLRITHNNNRNNNELRSTIHRILTDHPKRIDVTTI